MDNPEGQFPQPAVVLEGRAPTQGDGSGDLVGVGSCEVEGAIAAETHAQHIDTLRVIGVMLLHPFQDIIELAGVPMSFRVLGCDDDGGNLQTFPHSVQRSIAQHPVEVVAPQTGTVEEEYQRGGPLILPVVLWRIHPEGIAVAPHCPFCL